MEQRKDEAYQMALNLVRVIDEDLNKGLRHYRNPAGQLLTKLDEVINALLEGDLLLPET